MAMVTVASSRLFIMSMVTEASKRLFVSSGGVSDLLSISVWSGDLSLICRCSHTGDRKRSSTDQPLATTRWRLSPVIIIILLLLCYSFWSRQLYNGSPRTIIIFMSVHNIFFFWFLITTAFIKITIYHEWDFDPIGPIPNIPCPPVILVIFSYTCFEPEYFNDNIRRNPEVTFDNNLNVRHDISHACRSCSCHIRDRIRQYLALSVARAIVSNRLSYDTRFYYNIIWMSENCLGRVVTRVPRFCSSVLLLKSLQFSVSPPILWNSFHDKSACTVMTFLIYFIHIVY